MVSIPNLGMSASFAAKPVNRTRLVFALVASLFGGTLLSNSGTLDIQADSARFVCLAIAIVILAVTMVFWRTSSADARPAAADLSRQSDQPLWAHQQFTGGLAAQFCYVAAQIGVGAFFINYVTEQGGASSQQASYLLLTGMLCFLVGCFAGAALMLRVAPQRLLTIYGLISLALCTVVIANLNRVSVACLIALFFFMSIMFPTIFSLAIKQLGAATERASSLLILSMAGGALMPYFMGRIADAHGTAQAYLIPAACFAVVTIYAWSLHAPPVAREATQVTGEHTE